jgi:hypothetical protein
MMKALSHIREVGLLAQTPVFAFAWYGGVSRFWEGGGGKWKWTCRACLEGGAGVTKCNHALVQACKHAFTRIKVIESFSKAN